MSPEEKVFASKSGRGGGGGVKVHTGRTKATKTSGKPDKEGVLVAAPFVHSSLSAALFPTSKKVPLSVRGRL